MSRVLVAQIACIVLVAAAPPQGPASALKPGTLLYAMPGLPDSNFSKTVVLLLQHDSNGSLGVVLNRPTKLGVDEALDLKAGTSGIDLDVFWGGPVQPEAVLSLVRSRLPDSKARTIVRDVYLTQDLEEVKGVLGGRDGRLRARIFTGYAGWAPDQLAGEVRGRSWVLEPADAATVFSSEPSRMWEKVHEIMSRLHASLPPVLPGWPAQVTAREQVQMNVPHGLTGVGIAVEHRAISRVAMPALGGDRRRPSDHLAH
jgi:putative transcriptional regulator